jgi:flagellar hook-length control protein FliK
VSQTTATSTPNRLAQHLGNSSDERTVKAPVLTETDQNRFLDRVARAFKAAEGRQGVVKLRLHPPELGSLRIELRMQNGALTARLEAETAVTQSLLLEHAHALRDRLSEQGVRVERFDVDLTDRRSMDQPNGFQERSERERNSTVHLRREQLLGDQEASSPRPTASQSTPGKINVII